MWSMWSLPYSLYIMSLFFFMVWKKFIFRKIRGGAVHSSKDNDVIYVDFVSPKQAKVMLLVSLVLKYWFWDEKKRKKKETKSGKWYQFSGITWTATFPSSLGEKAPSWQCGLDLGRQTIVWPGWKQIWEKDHGRFHKVSIFPLKVGTSYLR